MKGSRLIILVIGILVFFVSSPGLTEEARQGKKGLDGRKVIRVGEIVVSALLSA